VSIEKVDRRLLPLSGTSSRTLNGNVFGQVQVGFRLLEAVVSVSELVSVALGSPTRSADPHLVERIGPVRSGSPSSA